MIESYGRPRAHAPDFVHWRRASPDERGPRGSGDSTIAEFPGSSTRWRADRALSRSADFQGPRRLDLSSRSFEASVGSPPTRVSKALSSKPMSSKQSSDESVRSLTAHALGVANDERQTESTQKLGDAVLAPQPDVIGAVQRLRQRAQANNQLASSKQQTVTTRRRGLAGHRHPAGPARHALRALLRSERSFTAHGPIPTTRPIISGRRIT